jgi:hypothetical protein
MQSTAVGQHHSLGMHAPTPTTRATTLSHGLPARARQPASKWHMAGDGTTAGVTPTHMLSADGTKVVIHVHNSCRAGLHKLAAPAAVGTPHLQPQLATTCCWQPHRLVPHTLAPPIQHATTSTMLPRTQQGDVLPAVAVPHPVCMFPGRVHQAQRLLTRLQDTTTNHKQGPCTLADKPKGHPALSAAGGGDP